MPEALLIAGQSLQRWQLASPAAPLRWELPVGLTAAVPSPDGALLVLTGGEGTAEVVTLAENRRVAALKTHTSVVKGAAFTPDGRGLLLISGNGNSFHYHDRHTWKTLGVIQSPMNIRRVAILGSGVAVAGTFSSAAILLKLPELSLSRDPAGQFPVQEVASSPSGAWIVVVEEGGRFLRFRSEELPVGEPLFTEAQAAAADISSDGERVVWAGRTRLQLRSVAGPVLWEREVEDNLIDVAFSPDDHLVAAASLEGPVRVWSVEDGALKAVLRGHNSRVPHVEFSPDGRSLYTASWDHSARRWGMEVLEAPIQTLRAQIEADWGFTSEQQPDGI